MSATSARREQSDPARTERTGGVRRQHGKLTLRGAFDVPDRTPIASLRAVGDAAFQRGG
jgi:hypothetical protein